MILNLDEMLECSPNNEMLIYFKRYLKDHESKDKQKC